MEKFAKMNITFKDDKDKEIKKVDIDIDETDLDKLKKDSEILTMRIKKVGKFTSIITFLLIFIVFLISMILYLITGAEHFKKAIETLGIFIDKYQWWWMTLSTFVGLTGLLKALKSTEKIDTKAITDLLQKFIGKK